MYDTSVQRSLKSISEIRVFEDLLQQTTLSDLDKTILRLHYLQDKDFSFIADELGYSESGIRKRHLKALKKLANII